MITEQMNTIAAQVYAAFYAVMVQQTAPMGDDAAEQSYSLLAHGRALRKARLFMRYVLHCAQEEVTWDPTRITSDFVDDAISGAIHAINQAVGVAELTAHKDLASMTKTELDHRLATIRLACHRAQDILLRLETRESEE